MGTLEKYIAGALAVIFVYLVVVNASGANQVLSGLSQLNVGAIKALQGR